MTLQPVRHLPAKPEGPDAEPRPAPRRVGIVAAAAGAALILLWPSAAGPPPEMTAPPPPSTVALSEPEPSQPAAPAVAAFASFIAAVNGGDVGDAVQLLASSVPEVTGLGTASFPYAATDPGLWKSGILDITNVAGFVEYAAALPGSVAISDCVAFADGPQVVIVSCDYSADGRAITPLGTAIQPGKLYGFMVDATVAGVAHRGGFDRPAWNQLLRWAKDQGYPTLGVDGEWTYSAETAQQIIALAEQMAAAAVPR